MIPGRSPLVLLRLLLLWGFVISWGVALFHGPHGTSNGDIIGESFPAFTQLGPSLVRIVSGLSLSVGYGIAIATTLGIAALTMVAGRWYCAALCPLGTLQDFSLWIRRRLGRRRAFRYAPPSTFIPWAILAIVAYGIARGITLFYSLFEPYSVAFRPFVLALDAPARSLAYHSFPPTSMLPSYPLTLLIAFGWTIFFMVLASFHGRFFCRYLCPVGALLNVLSRKTRWHIAIQEQRCSGCRRCEHLCRASCIDASRGRIDHSRCVLCFDCLTSCPSGAISYGTHLPLPRGDYSRPLPSTSTSPQHPVPIPERLPAEETSISRRSFVAILPAAGLIVAFFPSVILLRRAQASPPEIMLDGYRRHVAIPPGAQSLYRFSRTCVGCGLCVAACPSGVIRLVSVGRGRKLTQPFLPILDYRRAYCQYECRRCSAVCPTGALSITSVSTKQRTQLGRSVFVRSRCIMVRYGRACGACAEHCPTGAITLTTARHGGRWRGGISAEPQVNDARCIGCGACETMCPATPKKAIYVEGLATHRILEGETPSPTQRIEGHQKGFAF